MRSHKYIHDPKVLLKQGQAIVSGNAENKFVHRVTMVNLILAGFSPKVLATYCGDSERVLQTWVQKVDNEGWNSLIATKQKGRPSRLSEEQIAEIREAVKDDPNNYGYNVWDGPALSSYIEKTYNITYGVRAAQNLLHKMGFAIIRPQMYPSLEHPDEEAREDFKKKIKKITADPDTIPVFQDEVHFQAQTTITGIWAEKGSAPKVMSKPGKDNIAYSGFVIPKTGELITLKPGWFNFTSVIQMLREFLKARPCPEGKKYCIIMDNAPWHKKAMRLIWTEALEEYADIREPITYMPLPPYSPDLNPIEQVWRITRKEKTHNRYFSSLPVLTETLDGYFEELQKPNEQLKNLCTFKWFDAS